jgi:hypothetical protein
MRRNPAKTGSSILPKAARRREAREMKSRREDADMTRLRHMRRGASRLHALVGALAVGLPKIWGRRSLQID